MSDTDRTIRVTIAVVLALLYFFKIVHDPAGSILLILSVVLLVTGYTGYCALYRLFGFNGRKRKTA